MADTAEQVITVRKVTKVFRDFWLREKVTAVADLDLDVQRREVLGLLGPNGSGKSTTLKMILGLLYPTRGQIRVLDKMPTDVATKARIGFLPEETYLYPFLNARETLDFYGRLFKLPRAERNRRIDMLLDMVGLTGVAYRRIGEYSKGMQRRIGLAQALINDPDLLILDEPTSGMDPIGTAQIKDLIRTLCQRGKTIVLSSHLLADVEDVCDRVCILYGGRRRALGEISQLLAQQDLTQLTVERLDESQLAAVRAALQTAGRNIVNVSTPRDKLEDLFLRIVKDAQERKLATGGAVAGPVAAFLRDESDGRQLIEELVAAAAPEVALPPSTPAPQPVPEVRKELIEDLVRPSEPSAQLPAPSAAQPSAPVEADRGVIDELLGQKDRQRDDA